MNRNSLRRALIVLAMGGATFALFGTSFGINGGGCNYATNQDYANWFQTAGDAVIQSVSDTYFDLGTDYNTLVRVPATTFAQSVWANYLDAQIPDDLPNNTVVLR